MKTPPFIGIDWGTTNARAMLFRADGSVRAEREEPLGVGKIAAGGFPAAFARLTDGWWTPRESVPLLLSGMVGSRQGWIEAPYVACPANLTRLHRQLIPVPGVPGASIVPGLSRRGNSRVRSDVMRGEELQLLGLGERTKKFSTICIPGTHTKWVRADWPFVREFHTTMTGELFAAILGHTLFAKVTAGVAPATGKSSAAAFRDGLQRAKDPYGLTRELFTIRADTLLGKISMPEIFDRISGLLIGTEILHWRTQAGRRPRVALLASGQLENRYLQAFKFFGVQAEAFEVKGVTAAGFVALIKTSIQDGSRLSSRA